MSIDIHNGKRNGCLGTARCCDKYSFRVRYTTARFEGRVVEKSYNTDGKLRGTTIQNADVTIPRYAQNVCRIQLGNCLAELYKLAAEGHYIIKYDEGDDWIHYSEIWRYEYTDWIKYMRENEPKRR